MGTMGYANVVGSKQAAIRPARRIRKENMKISFKQRFRNWLLDDSITVDDSQYVETDRLQSDGMRLQIYKASGGYVVETRGYDRKTDRHNTTMHVIHEDKDLGETLGKIVMMEALRG
jgi:hypothetical protein